MSLVLFSGGCDSTLVLYNLAKQYATTSQNSYITALSINHCQVGANKENKLAREKIRQEFIKRELSQYIKFIELDVISANKNEAFSNVGGLSQPIIWSTISSLYANNEDTLYFGYHSGDDFWGKKYEFEQAIFNMSKVAEKSIKIEYPLIHHTKAEIIIALKERGLYELCWYCEYPVDLKPCGTCLPCKTHRTALWQIEEFNKKIDFSVLSAKTVDVLPIPTDLPITDLKGS